MLLFLVLVLVATLVLTGIAIISAVNDTHADMRRDIAGVISLERNLPEMDHDGVIEAYAEGGSGAALRFMSEVLSSGDFVTFETLEAIMEVSGVSGYNVIAEFTMRDAIAENFEFLNPIEGQFSNEHGEAEATTFAYIHSATDSQRLVDFLNGNLRLVAGRHQTADDHRTVMISDDLASINNIQIGDTLKISGAPTTMGDQFSSTTLEFEVIGIFSATRALEEDDQNNLAATFIIDMSTLMEEYARTNYFGTGAIGSLPGFLSIFMEDPNEIENVHDEISNLRSVYGKDFTLMMGSVGFEDVLSSLTSLGVLAQTLLVIIALVSMAILAIILTIWTRGRVKEIGIYLANGIKKGEIIGQFILEASLIAVVAFALSLPISQVTARGTGDFILERFTSAEALRSEQLEDDSSMEASSGIDMGRRGIDFNHTENGLENMIDMVEIGVSGSDLVWVYVIGLPVVTSSVLIASYPVVKLKPKEILTKMS